MARQDVDIGVEGNDGTGDSIRESFRKVNENFQEIYAIFGQSGTISFTALNDTPDFLTPNTIPLVSGDGSKIELVELASNSAVDSQTPDTISFSYTVGGKLIISTSFRRVSDDVRPALGAPMNAAGNAIANVTISQEAAEQFNDIHNTGINIDDLVITKGYADRRYISSGLPVRIAAEPDTQDSYKLNISRYLNGNIEVVDHGYDTSINGLKFTFDALYTDPTNLFSETPATEIVSGNTYRILEVGNVNWTSIGAIKGEVGEVFKATSTTLAAGIVKPVYFLRYVSDSLLSVFEIQDDAALVSDTDADTAKIFVSGTIASDDTHQMVDTGVDTSLEGNFLSDVAMPRESIVRRQGDVMEGLLTLSDHPGDLSGFGKPNGADDLQAATKFYVDNAGYSSLVNIFVSTDGDDKMVGVPAGKEGTSLNYAYRTINAAARRAEEIIRTSAPEPGPYFQTVTKEENNSPAEVTSIGFVNGYADGIQTGDLIRSNRLYLIKEITGWLGYSFPDFVFDQDTKTKDIGDILDAIEFDIRRGINANFLTREVAERYYSSSSSRIAITQQSEQTLGAIGQLKLFVNSILQNNLYNEKSIDSIVVVGGDRARVTTSTNHGLNDGDQVIFKDIAGMIELEDQTAYVRVIADSDPLLNGKIIELYRDAELLEAWDISAYTPYTTGGRLGQVFQDRVSDFESIKELQTFDEPNASDTSRLAITGNGGRFDLILNILENGIDVGEDIVYGSNYKLVLDNGSRTFVDQADPENTDTLPGKIMVGKISGAQGRIVKVTTNDGTEDNNDTFELVQLNGKNFTLNEPVEYGNFVKEKQITIFIESGTYEEDLPIKLANNVSIKGDEFRRVIIRPKKRVSQSPWADTYFFRDKEFDGITLATTGEPFYNQTNELQGYFGRHYLTDNELPKNTGATVNNVGSYVKAADIMSLNKEFLQSEVIYYVDNNKNQLLYNRNTCRRDLALIIDAVTYDVATGSNYKAIIAGQAYQRANNAYNLTYEKQNTLLAINESRRLTRNLPLVVADITAQSRSDAAYDEIIDIIENNTPDAFTFPVPSALPYASGDHAHDRLRNNRDFIIAEIIAWITDNYPLLDYDSAKCARDVGYIVDALSYDILYGGNSAIRVAASSYFDGAISQLGSGEAEATVDAYERLGDIVDQIVRGVAITTSTGNLESQDTTGTNATSTEGTQLNTLVSYIETVISEGSLSNLVAEVLPSIAWVTDSTENAALQIASNKNDIVNDVIDYLDVNINFTYNTAKCYRDVGLIVDGIIKDLIRGGQEFTLETQGEYYTNYINQFNIDETDGTAGFGGQATITKAAINHIFTLSQDLLAAVAPTQNTSVVPDVSKGQAESSTINVVDGLINLVTFAFEPEYNPPKRNDDDGVDVFMMSDASILRNATVQGHGGFMVVLDPAGQVLTKSPYIQTGSSFSKSDNEKRFRGGMYVDAFTGNIPVYVPQNINTGTYSGSGKINNFELWVRSVPGQGLFVRPPELPCPFYVDGRRYQVNAISDYDSGNGWCKIYLDAGSNPDDAGNGQGYDETQFPDGLYYRDIFLQTAGNRSMLGNDFTQINDLGYGLVTNNGAFSEMVSMFTYYCQVAYYAKNGSEIRSLNGSNGYGFFGLVSEGADPNEIPDQVTLKDPMVIPAKAYSDGTTYNRFEDSSLYLTDMRYPPTINSLVTIDHGGATGILNYVVSNVTNVSDTDNDGSEGDSVDDIVAISGTYSNTVYRLELRADDVSATDFFGSLRLNVPDGALIEYRQNFTHVFEGVRQQLKLVTRPSTAINFDESDDETYRSLSFQADNSFAQPLNVDEIQTGFEVGYNYVSLEIDTANITGGYGSAQGNTTIAVKPLASEKLRTRLTRDIAGRQPGDAGYSGGMLFTWNGKIHRITDYTVGGSFTYITIEDQGTNISAYGGTGISVAFTPADRVLKCGLDSGSTAEITISISLCRATGHDFTQIGTGSYNSSNYPNVILGDPENSLAPSYTDASTATSSQVWERRKGRVFWMSTDQFGFFRVGKFFSVDQATGDIEFAGEIGISNANSLGFKRGVTINEFSADDAMADNSGQAVPTERSVVGYVNRVLGWNVGAGSQIQASPAGNRIGTGFLPLTGGAAMEGDLDMGSNQITNLALPGTDGTAAANKNYVDDKVNDYDQLENLRNIEFNSIAKDDIVVATGVKRLITTTVTGGNWTPGDVIGLSSSEAKLGTVVDVESYTDSLLGSTLKVSYSATTGVFQIGETLYKKLGSPGSYTDGVEFATVVDGPIDEIANASEAAASDIEITVTRAAGGTEIDLQIAADTIIDDDVNSAANIRQSKLLMQAADTFDEDNATTGWAGTSTKVQSDLGLAKFSDENFDTLDGFVRIKNNGIAFAEIPDLAQNQLYARTASGTGDVSAVNFSDIAKFGEALEDKDFDNSEWTDPSVTRLVFTSSVIANDGDTITQGSVTGIAQGDTNSENVVYVTDVTGAGFNESGTVVNTTLSTTLGVPDTAVTDTTVGSALIKLRSGEYATTSISTGTAPNSIARRDATGKLDASGIKVGGFDTVALNSTTISFKTPGAATVFEATGNTSANLQVKVPGHLVLGGITNDGSGGFAESEAKTGSSYNVGSYIASSWMYTNFIEAASESGDAAAATTGIGLGTGSGYTDAAADRIQLIAGGNNTLDITNTGVFSNQSIYIAKTNGIFRIRNGTDTTNRFQVDTDNGNTTINGTLTVANTANLNGAVNIGNATSDTLTITSRIDSNVNPSTNSARNLGANALRWDTVYATTFNGVATQAKYADLAEKYVGDAEYEPGTVLVFGGDAEVTTTDTKGDHRVAGVVSTNPAYLMNSELNEVNTVEVALAGRVPCKVLGKVKKGDILVTAAIAGYAIANNTPGVGTVVGKALESKEDGDKGVIEIVVGRA